MADFTPAEIEDARNHPGSGDLYWQGKLDGREVYAVTKANVFYFGGGWNIIRCDRAEWLAWTRNSTLVRRGA